jgi:hypothetical protein
VSHAFPYRRPPRDVVRPGPWIRDTPDGSTELGTGLNDWDYNTVLSLRRRVNVDGSRARAGCGLPHDARLALTVRWTASNSMLRGRAWQHYVTGGDDQQLDIAFDLPGTELGGLLDLELMLTVLDSGAGSPSASAPRRPGSIVWSQRTAIDLAGDQVRFPIAVGDFAELLYPSETAWHLDIGTDLHAAALGTVLLVVNQGRPAVVEALTSVSTPSPEQSVIMSFLWADVLRGLVERAVTDEDFDPEYDYPTGSLGAVLIAVLAKRLPDMDIASLRREHMNDPAMFASRIQSAARLLAVPR